MANILNYVSQIFNKRPTKALKTISEAINQSLDTASADLDELKDQYSISRAGGEWLEIWGSWFNVYKEAGEQDNEYRGRILSMVSTPKNTIPAIKQAVATYLSSYYGIVIDPSQVGIYEPYTNIIKYSEIKSKYSGDDKYSDELFWRTNVISIIIPYGASESLKQILQTIKPAGLRIRFDVQLVPEKQNPGSGIPEPVLLNTMTPQEYTFISRYMRALGTDGFFHPFMDGMIKYSGVKNLRMWYELLIDGGNVIEMPSPAGAVDFYEILYYLRAANIHTPHDVENLMTFYLRELSTKDIVPTYHHEISIYPEQAVLGEYTTTPDYLISIDYEPGRFDHQAQDVEKDIFFYIRELSTKSITTVPYREIHMSPDKVVLDIIPSFHSLLSVDYYLKIIFKEEFDAPRELELSLGHPEIDGEDPIYESGIGLFLNYNDDEFNIRLNPYYSIEEIGDIPLSQPSWLTLVGPTQIEIL